MKKGQEEKPEVHVAFVGYEVDRVAKPIARRLRTVGSRLKGAYLITDEKKKYGDKDSQGHQCLKAVTSRLKRLLRKRFNPRDNIVYLKSRFSSEEIMSVTYALVRRELDDGNDVYINISSGNKLMASIGTMVGLMLGARLYYVEPVSREKPEGLKRKPTYEAVAYGMKSVKDLSFKFSIKEPISDEGLYTLFLMKKHGGLITQEELIKKLVAIGAIETNKKEQKQVKNWEIPARVRYFARNNIFNEIVGCVKNEGSKRNPLWKLTDEGKYWLKLFLHGNPYYLQELKE